MKKRISKKDKIEAIDCAKENKHDHMNFGVPDGNMFCKNLFKLNEKIDSKKLLKIMDTQLKRNSKSKFTASKVRLFKKLDWSKEKLKKYINKKDFLVFIEKY